MYRNPPEEKEISLSVDSLSWGGRGIGRIDGKVVFVHGAAPGDRLRVRVFRDKKSFMEAEILEILDPSPHRTASRCDEFPLCGGCSWLCVTYSKQAQEKEAILRNILRHHLEDVALEPLWSPKSDLGYRHRGTFHAATHANNALGFGFHRRGTRRVVVFGSCPLFGESYNEAFAALCGALRKSPAARFLASVTLASSQDGGSFAAQLHCTRSLPAEEAAATAALVRDAGLRGCTLSTPDERHRDFGTPRTTYDLPPGITGLPQTVALMAHVRSFTQSHLEMNGHLVQTALEWIRPLSEERVLDLYGGIGNFGIPIALQCGRLTSVEGAPTAVADARENARRAGALNISHLRGDCVEVLKGLAAEGERFDTVLLDPPRTGAREAVPWIARLEPRKVLYVSCDLPTLARDLALFREEGYRLRRVRAFDGFPQTHHLETICLLTRLSHQE